jgi:hypothetical protein
MKTRFLVAYSVLLTLAVSPLAAQTLYVPGGAGGINNISGSNVGIGTSAPNNQLVVSSGYSMRTQVTLSDTNTASLMLRAGAGMPGVVASDVDLQLRAGAYWTDADAGGVTGLTIKTVTGNVGIGTTAPAAALHVSGHVGREVARFQGSADVSNNRNFVSIYTTNPGYWWEFSNQDPSGGGTLNGLAFRERSASGNSVERVYFASGGNVGIGTASPTHKLAVNGTIRAKEVIVDTGWSDYVFKPDYKLASLSEVEGAIQRDGHLPGIPSAQEVAEHGVSMGEMQAKLLAKIEELTLHVIAQHKELTAVKQELRVLRKQN